MLGGLGREIPQWSPGALSQVADVTGTVMLAENS